MATTTPISTPAVAKPLLSICVPTYNRNEILFRNLAKLLPQLTSECILLILDNHSPVPVADSLGNLLLEYPRVCSKIVRHRVNIGGDLNILRCFELCETPWIWVLGDDDPPLPDAVAKIFDAISRWPDAIFLNFSSEIFQRSVVFSGRGRESFLDNLDSFSNVLFISCGIFRADAMQRFFVHGARFNYGNAPHFIILLLALMEDREFCFLERAIVNYCSPAPGTGWSYIAFSMQLPINADLPIPSRLQKKLRTILAWELGRLGLEKLVGLLLYQIKAGHIEKSSAVYIMDQIWSRGLCYHPNRSVRVQSWLCRLVVRAPFSLLVLKAVSRIYGLKPLPEGDNLVLREKAAFKTL